MQFVHLDQIRVREDRVRRDFDPEALEELADSIADFGLIQPPVLESDGRTLLAGERRLRAIRLLADRGKGFPFNGEHLQPGRLPVLVASEMGEADRLEVELHENLKRKDLTWQERARGRAQLHELRTRQAEANGETHTYGDTAEEVWPNNSKARLQGARVRREIGLAAWLDDPDIASAKNSREAEKVLERKLERGKRQALAREVARAPVETPHTPLHGDLRDVLPTLDAGTFDVIVADPPYGVGAHDFRNQSAERHAYDDSPEYADTILETIAREGYRAAKAEAHLYAFCDINRFRDVRAIFQGAGWDVFATPLIWFKGSNIGLLPRHEHGPRRTYEAILFAIKGGRRTLGVRPDVLDVAHDTSVERGAHKPPELFEELLRRSAEPGNHVLDPCCGTGPIFRAADRYQCTATGIEIDAEAFGYVQERLGAQR